MQSDPADKLDYIDAQLASLARAGEKLDHLSDVRADTIRKYPHLDRPTPKRPKPARPDEPVKVAEQPANGRFDPFAALFTG